VLVVEEGEARIHSSEWERWNRWEPEVEKREGLQLFVRIPSFVLSAGEE